MPFQDTGRSEQGASGMEQATAGKTVLLVGVEDHGNTKKHDRSGKTTDKKEATQKAMKKYTVLEFEELK